MAGSFAVLAISLMACSATSTPSPQQTTEPAATIPTSTPTLSLQPSAEPAATIPKSTPTPTPRLPAEPAATIPNSTPTRAPQVSSTPARLPSNTTTDRVFIQLTDPLDEPEFYCVDMPGAGRGVRLESDLQAHTCKPIATAADELFTIDHPNEGQIYMAAYDLCVEVREAQTGSPLRLKPCSDSQHQLFTFENGVVRENGMIRLSGSGQDHLCLAVAAGQGIPTGGPSHLRRGLTLEVCDSTDTTLVKWSVGLFEY